MNINAHMCVLAHTHLLRVILVVDLTLEGDTFNCNPNSPLTTLLHTIWIKWVSDAVIMIDVGIKWGICSYLILYQNRV